MVFPICRGSIYCFGLACSPCTCILSLLFFRSGFTLGKFSPKIMRFSDLLSLTKRLVFPVRAICASIFREKEETVPFLDFQKI